MRYKEEFFFSKEEDIDYIIDKEILDNILVISNKVNSPEYTKSPTFVKNKKYNKYNNQYSRNNEKDEKEEINNWKLNKNFKVTIKNKKLGIDNNIDSIRKSLNKMSLNTYELLKTNIINEIEEIINNLNDENITNDDDLLKISETIFTIASSNQFYSELYAKLYYDLMLKYDFIKENLTVNLNNFTKIFINLDINNTDNYETFCENNKLSDKRKALVSFYINLLKKNAITIEFITNFITLIQNNLIELLEKENKKELCEELSDIIYIFIQNSIEILIKNSEWDIIYNNILYISRVKNKTKLSITNKIIFKHLDMLDIIEDYI